MVTDQLRGRGVRDERVLAAMAAVPRDAFVLDRDRDLAYRDGPLSIGAGQTISQPYMVARMTELLRVATDERVLEIGTGSGYQAAVLAELGCRVTSIEREPGLAEEAADRLAALGYADRVEVRTGDGSQGAPDGAPWDGIVVAAGGAVGPRWAARAAGRGSATRDPGRVEVAPGPAGGGAARERVAGALGRSVRVRAAHRRGRLGAVTGAGGSREPAGPFVRGGRRYTRQP